MHPLGKPVAITNLLRSALNMRPGEGRPLAYLVVHSFFLGLTLLFLETAASTLFLNRFGVTMLPYAYMGIAVVVTVVGTGYAKLQNRLSFPRLLQANLGLLLLSIAALWFGLTWTQSRWPIFALFMWFEVTSTLISLEIWSLSGRLFNVRQSKRLFALVGTGGITAGILGGLSVPVLVPVVGTRNLLLVAIGGMTLSLWTLHRILRQYGQNLVAQDEEETEATSGGQGWRLIRDPYVLLFSLMAGLSVIAYYLVDFIFYDRVESRFTDEVKLASFFGLFYAVVGVARLVVQTFLSGRLITRFGLSFGLVALPAILLVGSSGTALMGTVLGMTVLFWWAVTTKLGDEVARVCIDEPSVFILYQPLRPDQRIRLQTLVEGMVEPIAGGLAAACLLLLTSVLGWDTTRLAAVLIVVLVIWTIVAILLRRRYTVVLMNALAKRSLKDVHLSVNDGTSVAILKRGLTSPYAEEVLYCLSMLDQIRHRSIEASLIGLLDHPTTSVRIDVLQRLEHRRGAQLSDAVAKRIELEPDAQVRGAALRTLCALGEEEAMSRVYHYLDDDNPLVRKGAIVGLLRSGGIEGVLAAGDHLTTLVKSQDPADRRLAAQVLGEVGIQSFYQPLLKLIRDDDLEVRRTALATAGILKNPRLWPLVVQNLSVLEVRRAATAALLAGGEAVLNELESAFTAPSCPPEQRSRLVTVGGRIGGHRATAWLLTHINEPHQTVRHKVLEALTACGFQATPDNDAMIRSLIGDEIQDATRTLASILDVGLEKPLQPLCQALRGELDHSRKRMFLLLSYLYPPQSVFAALESYTFPSADKRAYALEVIDNVVAQDLKEHLLPILDDLHPDQCLVRLLGRFPQQRLTRNRRLMEIITRPWETVSPWIQAMALFMIARVDARECSDAVAAGLACPSALVRETAAWTLARLNPPYMAQRLQEVMQDPAPQVARIAKFVLRARGLFGPRAGSRHLTRSGRLETDLYASVLLDHSEHRANRCRAARSLASLDPDIAHAALLKALQIPDETIRSTILEVLRRGRFPTVDSAREALAELLDSEIEDVNHTLKIILTVHGQQGFDQLTAALGQELDRNRTRILSILDMLGDGKAFDTVHYWYLRSGVGPAPKEAVKCLHRLVAHAPNTGARQIFLDLVSWRDPLALGQAWQVGGDDTPDSLDRLLSDVAFGSPRWIRPWTRVCALERIVTRGLKHLVPMIVDALKDSDAIVREMAAAALFQLDRASFDSHVAVLERDPSLTVSQLVRHLSATMPDKTQNRPNHPHDPGSLSDATDH